jgi:hypothetical protein
VLLRKRKREREIEIERGGYLTGGLCKASSRGCTAVLSADDLSRVDLKCSQPPTHAQGRREKRREGEGVKEREKGNYSSMFFS